MESKVRGTAEIETHHLSDTDQKSCPLRQLIRVSCYTKLYRNPSSGCSAESYGRTDQLSAQLALSLFIPLNDRYTNKEPMTNESVLYVWKQCDTLSE
jgi:hypothetical protein